MSKPIDKYKLLQNHIKRKNLRIATLEADVQFYTSKIKKLEDKIITLIEYRNFVLRLFSVLATAKEGVNRQWLFEQFKNLFK